MFMIPPVDNPDDEDDDLIIYKEQSAPETLPSSAPTRQLSQTQTEDVVPHDVVLLPRHERKRRRMEWKERLLSIETASPEQDHDEQMLSEDPFAALQSLLDHQEVEEDANKVELECTNQGGNCDFVLRGEQSQSQTPCPGSHPMQQSQPGHTHSIQGSSADKGGWDQTESSPPDFVVHDDKMNQDEENTLVVQDQSISHTVVTVAASNRDQDTLDTSLLDRELKRQQRRQARLQEQRNLAQTASMPEPSFDMGLDPFVKTVHNHSQRRKSSSGRNPKQESKRARIVENPKSIVGTR